MELFIYLVVEKQQYIPRAELVGLVGLTSPILFASWQRGVGQRKGITLKGGCQTSPSVLLIGSARR